MTRIVNDDYKPSLLDEAALEHYGVKGMKWGVRRDQSALDRAAGRTKSLDDSWFGKLANKNAQRYMRKQTEKGQRKAEKLLAKEGKKAKAGNPALVAYGAMVATLIVSQKVMMYRDSGRKDAKETGDRAFKQNPALKEKMSPADLHKNVVKPINPGFGEPGTKMNCRRATLTYEMRRRGNDVQATRSKHASGQDPAGMNKAVGVTFDRTSTLWGEKKISEASIITKSTPQQKADIILKDLAKNPNGSRGELGVAWTFGGGHSVAWEIVDNKPIIFDAQSGKMYASVKEFSEFTPVILEAAQTRLDNKPIDPEFIKRWVKDV
jgi:hypothetical protein